MSHASPVTSSVRHVVLCPGQGAQGVGMGRAWCEVSAAARVTFREADAALGSALGAPLSELCFAGPADRLNRTDVSQPALYVCSVACCLAMRERGELGTIAAAAGLSLGEYTALHLAGVFSFLDGLKLVATRGRLMQQAAEASRGSMIALIGADEQQALAVCGKAAGGPTGAEVIVCANFNAPGQIVLSGHAAACERAGMAASEMGLRAAALTVAGAFHSPLMKPAAEGLAGALAAIGFHRPAVPVWSNVTARPHDPNDMELLKRRLVEQIISPVRWAQGCQAMLAELGVPASAETAERNGVAGGLGGPGPVEYHELAPGSVLKGLMRRIDRNAKVASHDEPGQPDKP